MKPYILTGFSDEIAPELDAQLDAVTEFGLSHIELRAADGVNVSDLKGEKLREVARKLAQRGVRVSSLGSPIGKIGITEDFAPHLDKFKHTLEVAQRLEAPYIRLFSFYIPKGESPEQYRDRVFERMLRLCEAAKGCEAILLHENEKEIYGDNAARCGELMQEFSSDRFRAVFDFANFVEVGQDTREAYDLLRPYLAYIHIKDALAAEKRVVPAGQGDGQVESILSDLFASGYRGFLSLEPHLTDFSGLQALEQDVKKRGGGLDGKSAWKIALDALREILARIPAAQEA